MCLPNGLIVVVLLLSGLGICLGLDGLACVTEIPLLDSELEASSYLEVLPTSDVLWLSGSLKCVPDARLP